MRVRTYLLSGIAGVMMASPAMAQTATNPDSTGGDVESIVVTAEKRSEDINKVPVSVAAYNQESLDQLGVRDVGDISRLVPGLSVQPTGTALSIRGVKSNTGAATTGVYIDDTPVQVRGNGANAYPEIFDLDHIEVLRGPQGTLFGAGSEGGTIRFLTPQPDLNTWSAYGRADLADTYNGQPSAELGGAIGGPIADGVLGFRASLWVQRVGGWIDQVNRDQVDDYDGGVSAPNKNTNSKINMSGRVAFKYQPFEKLAVTLSVMYQEKDADDDDWYYQAYGPYTSFKSNLEPIHDKFFLPSLTIDYDLGFADFKSISSYFDRQRTATIDYGYKLITDVAGQKLDEIKGLDFDYEQLTGTDQQNYTQEFRLTSDNSGPFTYVVGIYMQNDKGFTTDFEPGNFESLTEAYLGETVEQYLGVPQTELIDYRGYTHYIENEMAAFGNLTYQVTDALRVTAGVRGAISRYSFRTTQSGPWAGPPGLTVTSGTQSERPVDPRFNITYDYGAGLVYATAAKGYRVGGANNNVPSTCNAELQALGLAHSPNQYKSDSDWSYELGVKQGLFGGRVQLNASAYDIQWSHIQTRISLYSCGFGFVTNLATAASQGFDLQGQFKIFDGLSLDATLGYDSARYTKDVKGEKNYYVRKGQDLGVPHWQGTLGIEYQWPIFRHAAEAYARIDDQYTGSYYNGPEFADEAGYNPLIQKTPNANYVQVRSGVAFGDWDVSAYVDNLFNAHPALLTQYSGQVPNHAHIYTFRPLTGGLTATFRY